MGPLIPVPTGTIEIDEITPCAKMRGAFVFGGFGHHNGQPVLVSDDLALDEPAVLVAGGDPSFLIKGQA